MSVLDRAALEDSPLADLHSLASELGIDGFRRLRKAELIDAILARQGGEAVAASAPEAEAPGDDEEERPRRARRRGGRGRTRRDDDEAPAAEVAAAEPTERTAEGVVDGLHHGLEAQRRVVGARAAAGEHERPHEVGRARFARRECSRHWRTLSLSSATSAGVSAAPTRSTSSCI